jgi:DNA-binding transcriptional LysR family regulator
LLYRAPGRVVQWLACVDDVWSEVTVPPTLICNDGAELVAEARAGAGIALVPKWGVEDHLQAGRLHTLTLHGAKISISRNESSGIFLLYHQPKYRLNKIKTIADAIVAELAPGG